MSEGFNITKKEIEKEIDNNKVISTVYKIKSRKYIK
jgi:hypothetical protein